jgi:hypothetical protein
MNIPFSDVEVEDTIVKGCILSPVDETQGHVLTFEAHIKFVIGDGEIPILTEYLTNKRLDKPQSQAVGDWASRILRVLFDLISKDYAAHGQTVLFGVINNGPLKGLNFTHGAWVDHPVIQEYKKTLVNPDADVVKH